MGILGDLESGGPGTYLQFGDRNSFDKSHTHAAIVRGDCHKKVVPRKGGFRRGVQGVKGL